MAAGQRILLPPIFTVVIKSIVVYNEHRYEEKESGGIMSYRTKYEAWLADPELEEDLRAELLSIAADEEAIKERFYRDLEFGTGGMRGIMGAGSNRMNRYTIQKVTAGFAAYLLSKHHRKAMEQGVVIAYDSRLHSREFALEAALVLAAYGIHVHMFEKLTPTPMLSFAVRELAAVGGIVITASHNTHQYNGYKVYDENGCQLVPSEAEALLREVERFQNPEDIPIMMSREVVEDDGLLKWLGEDWLERFNQAVLAQSLYPDALAKAALSVVYTPLHGTGREPVMRVLSQDGFTQAELLSAQAEPDATFSTVRSPNPEERDALALAIAWAEGQNADLVVGTDPDCDRVGVAVKSAQGYQLLSGNQVGALLLDFVLGQKKAQLNKKSTVIKTIVTSDMGAKIAASYGVQMLETLTGFKFIGQKMTQFQLSGSHEFIMGYEESYGYLVGTHARDKDAVVSAMLICEMAAWYKAQNLTLADGLERLYQQFGYYVDEVQSYTLEGISGQERIAGIMKALRGQTLEAAGGLTIEKCLDYQQGVDGLPPADVLKYIFAQGGWMAVRPSGTEPKIKFYYSLPGCDEAQARARVEALKAFAAQMVGQ